MNKKVPDISRSLGIYLNVIFYSLDTAFISDLHPRVCILAMILGFIVILYCKHRTAVKTAGIYNTFLFYPYRSAIFHFDCLYQALSGAASHQVRILRNLRYVHTILALYREYNPNTVSGAHNYTTSLEENNNLLNAGWNFEGIAWYGTSPKKNSKQ